jgi:hypothetical protein
MFYQLLSRRQGCGAGAGRGALDASGERGKRHDLIRAVGRNPRLVFRRAGFHVSWPVIAIAAAAVIVLVLVVAWIALTASRRGSRHGSQPRPARGRHQGAHARRPRLWRHGDHGVPV